MRKYHATSPFKRDWKRVQRSGACSAEKLKSITDLLLADLPLPERLRDHALSGQWAKIGARDCHVTPDLILIYAKPPGELRLLRLASHSELFKK
jgi:mRNA interferase YafQ